MLRPLIALIAGGLVAFAATAIAETPQKEARSTGAVAPARGRDAELDAEHPPLGKDAVRAEARRDQARQSAAADEAAALQKRKADAAATQKKARRSDDAEPDSLPVDEGSYRGVALDTGNAPPVSRRVGRHGRKAMAQLTWIGFRVEEGVPMVFAQLSQPVVWSVEEKPGSLVYTLQAVGVPLSNNRRPLDVSAFGTGVKGVVAARKGRDVTLTVTFSSQKPAKRVHRERHQDAPGGYKFLVIELPAG
jgi:hypothetical protein